MTIQEILSRWFEFSGYDPNQHKFNLLSSEWDYHKAGDRISALLTSPTVGTPWDSWQAVRLRTFLPQNWQACLKG